MSALSIRCAPSFRPEHTTPRNAKRRPHRHSDRHTATRNSNAARTVIPNRAHRTPQHQTLPAPSFRPSTLQPATPNAARTVIPTGADRLFSSAFASCERVGLRSGGISLRLRTCPSSRHTVSPLRVPCAKDPVAVFCLLSRPRAHAPFAHDVFRLLYGVNETRICFAPLHRR